MIFFFITKCARHAASVGESSIYYSTYIYKSRTDQPPRARATRGLCRSSRKPQGASPPHHTTPPKTSSSRHPRWPMIRPSYPPVNRKPTTRRCAEPGLPFAYSAHFAAHHDRKTKWFQKPSTAFECEIYLLFLLIIIIE